MGCIPVVILSRNNSIRFDNGKSLHTRCAIFALERIEDNSDGVVMEMEGKRSSPVAGLMF